MNDHVTMRCRLLHLIFTLISVFLCGCTYKKQDMLDEISVGQPRASLSPTHIVNPGISEPVPQSRVLTRPSFPDPVDVPVEATDGRSLTVVPPIPLRQPANTKLTGDKTRGEAQRAAEESELQKILNELQKEDVDQKNETVSTRGIPLKSVFDQGTSAEDRNLTKKIRKALMDDPSISFRSKNIAVITKNGRVTLQGIVKNAEERRRAGNLAERFVSQDRIVNNTVVGRVSDFEVVPNPRKASEL